MCSSNWFPPISTPGRIYIRTFPTRRNEKDGYYLNFYPVTARFSRFIWIFLFFILRRDFMDFANFVVGYMDCCHFSLLSLLLLSCAYVVVLFICCCLVLCGYSLLYVRVLACSFFYLCGDVLCAPQICFLSRLQRDFEDSGCIVLLINCIFLLL